MSNHHTIANDFIESRMQGVYWDCLFPGDSDAEYAEQLPVRQLTTPRATALFRGAVLDVAGDNGRPGMALQNGQNLANLTVGTVILFHEEVLGISTHDALQFKDTPDLPARPTDLSQCLGKDESNLREHFSLNDDGDYTAVYRDDAHWGVVAPGKGKNRGNPVLHTVDTGHVFVGPDANGQNELYLKHGQPVTVRPADIVVGGLRHTIEEGSAVTREKLSRVTAAQIRRSKEIVPPRRERGSGSVVKWLLDAGSPEPVSVRM